ncbi:uncharacterized protein nell3 [Gadus chalcogrammus]|uniref:uncharacterized protein nell3 n=1 Tax=Gadus chalcogrammus TaxID=1042646 RepID=UPI0024C4CF84|nr:uncharacterized protein nell3 [Gadus chalcogrammus]
MELSRLSVMLALYCSPLMVRCAAEPCQGTQCHGGETGDPRPCVGEHCPGGRSSRPRRHVHYNPANTGRAAAHAVASSQHAFVSSPRAAVAEGFAAVQPPRGRDGGSARTRTGAEAFPSGCHDGNCGLLPPAPPQRHLYTVNETRDCRGIECKLPLRIRLQPRPKPCVGDACLAGSEEGQPVHLRDRAAQFMGEMPEFGYPSSELGGAPLGVQLTCDIKPGENEVPSEDALILHLQLSKGQESLVEALRAQQVVIRDLQQKLVDQQEALLSQQRDILAEQRRMYEQMDTVKAQYGMLSDTVKQVSFQGLQGELQSYFQSHLAGLQSQARSQLQKSYAVHKMDADSKVVEVMDVLGEAHFPQPLFGCTTSCSGEEFCDFQKEPPRCERCTMCPPGFFLISQCSPNTDRMCQDRDECLELPSICGERVKCLNTPGGFRCLGISEREAETGVCGLEYFYNQELQECQACFDCDGQQASVPCTAVSDTVCTGPLLSTEPVRLSQAWGGNVQVPPARSFSRSSSYFGSIFPGLQLNILGSGDPGGLLSMQGGRLRLQQHGLLWLDHNFALKHSCRNFLQLGMRLNGSQEEESGRWDLSGVRIEQPDGKYFQSVSVSGAVEVEPNHTLSLVLKSPNQHCNQTKDLHAYDLHGHPFSLFWLSHDTGSVAMTAQTTVSAHYQTSYRPTFRTVSVSDAYMVGLTHDSRGVRFTESGVVKFVLQQALYAVGHTCVREGFSVVAYTNHNGSAQEVMRAFKAGVNYRDTSVTLSGAVRVDAEDTLTFEVSTPAQCNVRYFGDSSGISVLSLVWIPAAVSSALTATVSPTGLPSGAVRNKPLFFQQVSPDSRQIHLSTAGEPNARKNFVFREQGTANVALNLKLIHSCNVVKLSLHRVGGGGSGGGGSSQAKAGPVAQQVSGHMPEGSEWASLGLRASFEVQNGTAIYVTLDCVRGRVNQITNQGGTNISILWVTL